MERWQFDVALEHQQGGSAPIEGDEAKENESTECVKTRDVRLRLSRLTESRSEPSIRPQKTEKEIHTEIQAIIRQITASVTFLPVIEEKCKANRIPLLCFRLMRVGTRLFQYPGLYREGHGSPQSMARRQRASHRRDGRAGQAAQLQHERAQSGCTCRLSPGRGLRLPATTRMFWLGRASDFRVSYIHVHLLVVPIYTSCICKLVSVLET